MRKASCLSEGTPVLNILEGGLRKCGSLVVPTFDPQSRLNGFLSVLQITLSAGQLVAKFVLGDHAERPKTDALVEIAACL